MMLFARMFLMFTMSATCALGAVDGAAILGDEPADGELKIVHWAGAAQGDGGQPCIFVTKVVAGEGEDAAVAKVDVHAVVIGHHPDGDGDDVELTVDVHPGGATWYANGSGLKIAGPPGTVVLNRIGGVEAGGPWLGIRFGPVPKALAAHLRLDEGIGQMVLNVIDESPADLAGLQQYDVIVEIDGEQTPSDIQDFLGMVRGFEPGDTYTFEMLRGGQRVDVSLTVGERPETMGEHLYKYEDEVEELSKGRVLRRGGLLEKDEDGSWTFKRFDLPGMHDIFKVFPEELENLDFDFDFDFHLDGFPDAHQEVFVCKSGKAETLRIERTDDGEIKVTRAETSDDGETTTTKVETYADEEELKEGDPEAYEVLSKGHPHKLGHFGKKGGMFRFFNLPDRAERHRLHEIFREKLDLDLDEIRKEVEEARLHAEGIRGKLEKRLRGSLHELHERALIHSKPRTSFEVLPDGQIKVIRRHGDGQLVEIFENAESLKEERPDLHRKFLKLQG